MRAVAELTPEILQLHAAIDIPSLWSAMCALLERATPNHFIVAGLRAERCKPTVVLRSRYADRPREWYQRNLGRHPGFDYLREHPGTRVIRVSDIMPTTDVLGSDYYRQFMEPEGWLHGLGIFFWHGPELHAFVGVNRTAAQGDFTAEDLAHADALHPHLQVAVTRVSQLHATRASERSLMRLLMDLPLPTLLADWEGRLTYANREAVEHLKVWDSGDWRRVAKRRSPRLPADLRDFCLGVRKEVEAGLVVNEPSETGATYSLEHATLPGLKASVEVMQLQRELLTPPGFLVRLEGKPRAGAAARALPQLVPLTPRERELALLVCEGLSNDEIAGELGKTTATVKTQLRSIFQKLNVRNRSSLTALLRPVG